MNHQNEGMSVLDPVCEMEPQPLRAAAREEFDGRLYYFCSDYCHQQFIEDPAKYAPPPNPAGARPH